MKFAIPQKCIRYSLMIALSYLIFEKYNLKYNLENCLLVTLSYLVLNRFFKRVEGFEGEEESSMDDKPVQEESPMEETPDQEEEPEIIEEIIEEISDEPAQEEAVQEEAVQEEAVQEEAVQEEAVQEEAVQEEAVQEEEEAEPKAYSSEELKELQSKYTIMPVESWIKNEISLMKESQQSNQSCACPTLSRASNDYLEF